MRHDRRDFFAASATLGMGVLAFPLRPAESAEIAPDKRSNESDQGIAAAEDLMREHGVLNRLLLIFEEGLRRLRANDGATPEMFHKPAMLVRKFVEDYHEKLEEKFIFPEFEKARKLTDLIKVLKEQHQAGRKLTDVILRNAVAEQFHKADVRTDLVRACEGFIRMYRPHEAREDTVLFPALHQTISAKRLKELGDQFEEQEDQLFGDEGFEKTVKQVEEIEKQLNIYDLTAFTPK